MLVLNCISVCFMSVSCFLSFVSQRRHLLMSLLALEGIILTLVLMLVLTSSDLELFYIFILVSFGACEASLGLACLVSMMRAYGNDHIKGLSGLKC
uniref:NADH dehydrogenase subunit 4L n=1 Tax=Phyllodoce medipapillata TaxID=868040 RepID=UPI0030FEB576